jgi:GT2 family glycosyltransferase
MSTSENVALVIASAGRPIILEETLRSLASSVSPVKDLIVVGATQSDLPPTQNLPDTWKFVIAPSRGLTVQRNFGVQNLPSHSRYVVFLDDDMEVADSFFAEVQNAFEQRPDVAAFSGNVIENGNIDRDAARTRVASYSLPEGMPAFGLLPDNWPGLYGCAMCVRREVVEKEPFDEALPLYALGEDIEAGFRFRRHGLVGGSARCVVAHLAVRTGRLSEFRVGYSQIANCVYFWQKNIGYSFYDLLRQLSRTISANLIYGVLSSRDFRANVDRRGRLRGNVKGLLDWPMRKLKPNRILEFK